MKILLVISKFLPEYSGPGFRIFNSYKRLSKTTNINLEVFCQSEEENSYKNYNLRDIHIKRLKKISIKNKSFLKKILNNIEFFILLLFLCLKLNKKKYDIIHVAGSSTLTTAGLYASRIKKIPLFFELVNASSSPIQINKILNFFYKINLHDNTIISCLSEKLKKECEKHNLVNNIWLRPNPIDEKKFFYKKNNNFEKIILLNINQFIPRKNQIFLIEVMKLLPEKYKLVLAGPTTKIGKNKKRDKNYLSEIKKLILQYNLSDRINLIEKFINPEDYYYKSHFYLMPSHNEGLGTTFLESLACGIPVIANKSEDVFHEWIDDGINGKLLTLQASKWANEIMKFPYKNINQKIKFSKKIIEVAGNKKFDNKKLKLLKSLMNYKKDKKIFTYE